MKVAVTTTGEGLTAEVDARFGRTRKFLVFDTETEETEIVENSQAYNTPQGAGIQAAENIMKAGATAVITGNVGPNAHRALSAAKIEIYIGASGTVAEAIEAYKKGELESAASANVDGHWV